MGKTMESSMNYKDLERHVESRIRLEQEMSERLHVAITAIAAELRQQLAFPTPTNGSVEETGRGVAVVASFQLRRDEQSKKGAHSLRCAVQVVEEGGRIVAYIDRASEAFEDVEAPAGRQKLLAAVDAALTAGANAEDWLTAP
jgi:hypothetical protein